MSGNIMGYKSSMCEGGDGGDGVRRYLEAGRGGGGSRDQETLTFVLFSFASSFSLPSVAPLSPKPCEGVTV